MKKLLKELSRHKWAFAILIGSLVLEAVVTGLFPYTRGWLYEIFSSKSGPFWLSLGFLFLNGLLFDTLQSFKAYLVTKVALVARETRTNSVLDSELNEMSNIPQRIQEDIKLSYMHRATVLAEYLVSGLILVQLTIINLHVPILLLGSFLYAVVSVFIAMKFNPRLTKAEIGEQQHEANYRTSLVEVLNPFGLLNANKASLWAAKIRMHYSLFTRLQTSLVVVLPYIVLGPLVLTGAISLGILIQHATTFGLIVVNAAILLTYYTTWIKGTASEMRVGELEK